MCRPGYIKKSLFRFIKSVLLNIFVFSMLYLSILQRINKAWESVYLFCSRGSGLPMQPRYNSPTPFICSHRRINKTRACQYHSGCIEIVQIPEARVITLRFYKIQSSTR